MARPRQRVRLEDGLWLDLNKLLREGFWPRRKNPLIVGTRWTSNRRGVLASALITVQKEGEDRGVLKVVVIGKFEQRLDLIAQPRNFGGRQWYFKCPVTGRKCSVVWLPPGASRFCSRQAWGKQVAYSTQFEAPFDQALVSGLHLERKHLRRTTPESRRYGNSIRQVQHSVRERHQPDLDLVCVRRHEVDAAIAGTET
jgi:hypothetical protein